MDSLPRRLLGLFASFFRIAAFTLGGGMVMLPLMEEEFVRKRRWLEAEDFIGIVTMVNALPGVIAVNTSLIVGRKIAGPFGAAVAFAGAILPSVSIILLLAPVISIIRENAMVSAAFVAVRAAVAALILKMVFRQAKRIRFGWSEAVFAVTALGVIRIAGIHPVLVIPAAGAAGILVYGREEKGKL